MNKLEMKEQNQLIFGLILKYGNLGQSAEIINTIKNEILLINIVIMNQQEDEQKHEHNEEKMHMKEVKYLNNYIMKY